MSMSRFVAFRLTPFLLVLCLLAAMGSLLTAPVFVLAEEDENADTEKRTYIQENTENYVISASWPIVGIDRADEESEAMVRNLVNAFKQTVQDSIKELSELDIAPSRMNWELHISHEVSEPSDKAVSILWKVWTYTGGAHGQLEMISNNYDRNTGYPLLWEDLFLDPDLALVQCSREARKQLAEPDEDNESSSIIDDMLREGTEPTADNYKVFTLIPEGIRIHFPPYQVAPWAAGPRSVDVTLRTLAPAKLKLEYWP